MRKHFEPRVRWWGLAVAAVLAQYSLAAAPAAAPAFSLSLPGVKIGYPGAEYWAEIEAPDGKKLWAFAVFSGSNAWTVPIQPERAGVYRLQRVERRQGGQVEPVELGAGSALELEARQARKARTLGGKTLVEAGEFQTIFTAVEPWCVNDHTLVQGPDRTWHLFGITHPKPLDFFKDPGRRLAHATATTLLQQPWQAQAPKIVADWDRHREYLLWAPHVVRHRGTYYLYVCVGDKATHRYPIHLLTSPDLESWTRHPANPMAVDGFDGRDPMVLRAEGQWLMYYTATTTPEGGNHIVAAVRSSDLVHWTGRRVVFTHPRAGTFGGPTESPFVVRRGAHYYLFVCDNDWTDVYLSKDPWHWDFEAKVGRIRSHASEVARDRDGRWYISHAGWMNGPVSLAPLRWLDGLDRASTSVSAAR